MLCAAGLLNDALAGVEQERDQLRGEVEVQKGIVASQGRELNAYVQRLDLDAWERLEQDRDRLAHEAREWRREAELRRAELPAVLAATEKVAREQAADELIAWADTLDRDNASLRTLRRHVGMCAQRIAPKPSAEEVVEALRRGDFVGCVLDEAGRAIPPVERGTGAGQ